MRKVTLREVEESPLFLNSFGIANALYGVSRRDFARILKEAVTAPHALYRQPRERLGCKNVNTALPWDRTKQGRDYWALIFKVQNPKALVFGFDRGDV